MVFAEKMQEEDSEESKKAAEKALERRTETAEKAHGREVEKADVQNSERRKEYIILQDISILPEGYHGESTASAIRLYGGFLFVANRGDDSIAMYEIQNNGTLILCCIKKPAAERRAIFRFSVITL